jgi:hypothetical protein
MNTALRAETDETPGRPLLDGRRHHVQRIIERRDEPLKR